jgi:type I restriction enzyme M protein
LGRSLAILNDTEHAALEPRASEKDGKDQLKSYTNATGAPLAMWSNGVEAVVWNRNNLNHFTPISAFPTAGQTIAAIVNEPWTIQNLIDKEAERAAKKERARTLRDIVTDMENEVLANVGVDVFEEVVKLVFIKLYDEMECHRGKYTHLRFRNNDTAERVKRTLGSVFEDARAK